MVTKSSKPTEKKSMVPMGNLTPNQKIFCDEWLKDRNGTRAYKKAYKNVKKEKTAAESASRLLSRNVNVKAYCDKRLEKISKKAEVDQEWLLDRYKKLAGYSISDFFDNDGKMKPLSEIPEDSLYAIQGLEVDTRVSGDDIIKSLIQKFKLPDKRSSLDSIAKLLGLITDKLSVEGGLTLEQKIMSVEKDNE